MKVAPLARSRRLVAGEVEYASKWAWLLKEPSRFNAFAGTAKAADRLGESQGLFPGVHGARKHRCAANQS
jgi:hypothetical protein